MAFEAVKKGAGYERTVRHNHEVPLAHYSKVSANLRFGLGLAGRSR